MFPQLPFELLENIVLFVVEQDDLYHLCLTNAAFHAAATHALYEHPRPPRLRSLFLLDWSLRQRRSLRTYVRVLDLLSCGYAPNPMTKSLLPAAFSRLVSHLLQRLTNLQRLLFPVRSYLYDPRLLPSCLSKSITTIELDLHHEGLYSRVSFLRDLPQLRELSFREWHRTVDWTCLITLHRFPRTVLPNLEKLSAPLGVVNALIPGRPVTTARVDGAVGKYYLALAAPLWAYSTGPIKSLALELVYIGIEEIALLCAHLPGLEELELRSKNLDGREAVNNLMSRQSLQCLEAMTRLARLTVILATFRDLISETWLALPLALSHVCPELKEIVLDGKSGLDLDVLANVRFRREISTKPGEGGGWRREDRIISRW